MSTNKESLGEKKHKWPLKTFIEMIPIVLTVSALFTFGVAKRVTTVKLLTPLSTVTGGLPLWGIILMVLVGFIGLAGVSLGIYIFSRAPMRLSDNGEEMPELGQADD